MGVLIKVNDVTFTNTVGVAEYPILSSLKNLYFMGGTEAATLTDHSGNANNGTKVGTVTVNTHSVTFAGTGTDNKITAQDLPASMSGLCGIALVKKTGKRDIFSQGNSTSCIHLGTGRLLFKTDTDSNLRDVPFSLADSNDYYIIVFNISATSYKVYIDRKNIGLTTIASGIPTGNSLALGTSSASKMLNVGGSSYNFAMNGTADIVVAAFYDAFLTEAQIKDAVSYLRLYGEKCGLTIN